MKKNKQATNDGVSRRNFERLLKDLAPGYGFATPAGDEERRLNEEYDALVEEFKRTPRMKALGERIDRKNREHRAVVKAAQVAYEKLRRLYWSEGLTARVVAMAQKMVADKGRA